MRTKVIEGYQYCLIPGGRELHLRFDGVIGFDRDQYTTFGGGGGSRTGEGIAGEFTRAWAQRFAGDAELRMWAGNRSSFRVFLTGKDYASYGIGGGEALIDVDFGSVHLLKVDERHPFRGTQGDGWVLVRGAACPAIDRPRVLGSSLEPPSTDAGSRI